MKTSGRFIKFLLTYREKKSGEQATAILDRAKASLSEGAAGVAITYSANYGQTLNIRKTYSEGHWQTGTSGANQAAVMTAMERLMGTTYANLQTQMRIAPITTMTYSDYGGKTHLEVVNEDLDRIKTLLDNGWDVLGWINESSNPNYAVGGGVASSPDPNNPSEIRFPPILQAIVQQRLSQYAEQYV